MGPDPQGEGHNDMGRGLSDLQRFILVRAATTERLYYADVLEGFFGWVPRPATGPGGHRFSRREIGEAAYRKAMASLSRACRRLEWRGLVTRLCGQLSHWSAVEITEKGKACLSVNRRAGLPPPKKAVGARTRPRAGPRGAVR
jgi:hypothetical protein